MILRSLCRLCNMIRKKRARHASDAARYGAYCGNYRLDLFKINVADKLLLALAPRYAYVDNGLSLAEKFMSENFTLADGCDNYVRRAGNIRQIMRF